VEDVSIGNSHAFLPESRRKRFLSFWLNALFTQANATRFVPKLKLTSTQTVDVSVKSKGITATRNSFTGKNYAAATAKTSAKSKLAMTLVAFGTQGCVCADVHWRHCNNVPQITFSTSPTAANASLRRVMSCQVNEKREVTTSLKIPTSPLWWWAVLFFVSLSYLLWLSAWSTM